MSNSRAQVQLFIGGRPSETFYIPSDRAGTIWTVFQLDGLTMNAFQASAFDSGGSADAAFY